MLSSCFTSLQRLPSIVGRQSVTQDTEFFVLIEGDFENLVDQIAVGRELVQRMLEEFELHIEIHSFRSIKADQSGVDHDPGILTMRTRTGGRSPEVSRVPGHEGPVAIENDGFELPVLPAAEFH